MKYFYQIYRITTYEIFMNSDRTITGVTIRSQNLCDKVEVGDRFICYLSGISRWFGVLEVESKSHLDKEKKIFYEKDPFVIHFKVKPLVLLDIENSIPRSDPSLASTYFSSHDRSVNIKLWRSIGPLDPSDGSILEKELTFQSSSKKVFPLQKNIVENCRSFDRRELEKKGYCTLSENQITTSKELSEPDKEENEEDINQGTRESLKIQALLAKIGETMGFKIWIPTQDRNRVIKECQINEESVLSTLPFNYNNITTKTIEQIDIIWVQKSYIVRAFEVEDTTSIYSGLLRMSDLISLQSNLDIKLHIVAPDSRREKVLGEIKRPTFDSLPKPLPDICSYLSYDSIVEISRNRHLNRLKDSILDDYEEIVDPLL